MKFPRILIPIAVLLALTWLLHRYVWLRLVRDAIWPQGWSVGLTVGIFTLGALIPLVMVLSRSLPRTYALPLSWVAFSWMGFLFYLFVLSVLADAGRGAAAFMGLLPQDAESRNAIAKAMALGIGGVSGLLGVGALANVARGFKIRHVRIPLEKLPAEAAGFVIVQLSDVHVGPTIGRNFIANMVREVNALNPDLIVITGDLVDGPVGQLRGHIAPLAGLRSRHGAFFVTGNHEYYSGVEAWMEHLPTLGLRILRNERVAIGGHFELAGVDDRSAAGFSPRHGQDLSKALAGRDTSLPLVLLAHQPKAFREAVPAGVDLQLSGHVHGGQIFPFDWLARLDQPLIAGLHRLEKTWVYVSEGTGYWGPPMRLGTRCEITRIELMRAH